MNIKYSASNPQHNWDCLVKILCPYFCWYFPSFDNLCSQKNSYLKVISLKGRDSMKSGFSISRRREYGNLISHQSNIWHRSNIWHQSIQKRERIHLMILIALLHICERAIVCQLWIWDVVSNSHAPWYFAMLLINGGLFFGPQV